MMKNCPKHGETEHSIRKDNGAKRCRKCMVDAVNKRRRKVKELAIAYKGGKCENCGYSKCIDAFDFHHIDPTKKEFSIGDDGNSRSWQRTKEELDKCKLLCANCHREIHSSR